MTCNALVEPDWTGELLASRDSSAGDPRTAEGDPQDAASHSCINVLRGVDEPPSPRPPCPHPATTCCHDGDNDMLAAKSGANWRAARRAAVNWAAFARPSASRSDTSSAVWLASLPSRAPRRRQNATARSRSFRFVVRPRTSPSIANGSQHSRHSGGRRLDRPGGSAPSASPYRRARSAMTSRNCTPANWKKWAGDSGQIGCTAWHSRTSTLCNTSSTCSNRRILGCRPNSRLTNVRRRWRVNSTSRSRALISPMRKRSSSWATSSSSGSMLVGTRLQVRTVRADCSGGRDSGTSPGCMISSPLGSRTESVGTGR
jgi:hypothetical protein